MQRRRRRPQQRRGARCRVKDAFGRAAVPSGRACTIATASRDAPTPTDQSAVGPVRGFSRTTSITSLVEIDGDEIGPSVRGQVMAGGEHVEQLRRVVLAGHREIR